MHILGAYVHICARYKVSVIKPVDRTVHRWWQCWWQHQQWHTKDNSWLHRLICYQQMSQKWANYVSEIIFAHHQQKIVYRSMDNWCFRITSIFHFFSDRRALKFLKVKCNPAYKKTWCISFIGKFKCFFKSIQDTESVSMGVWNSWPIVSTSFEVKLK